MTKRVGWLEDDVGYVGGAEMSGNALRTSKPDWAQIVPCEPQYRPPEDIDVFIIQNQVTYPAYWIEELALAPVVKQIRDPWFAGSAKLRRWLLDNADLLLFSSPTQVEAFDYPFDNRYEVIPVPLDLQPFRDAAKPEGERAGNVFVGRCDVFKGAHAAVDWALREMQPLDLFGVRGFGGGKFMDFGELPDVIRFHGQVPYSAIPEVLGGAKRFVFFPSWPEAFGRSVAEAWAAGCKLLVEGRVGALDWIHNDPDALERGTEMFWGAVESVL